MDKYAGVKPYYKNFGPRFGFAYQLCRTPWFAAASASSITRRAAKAAACACSGSFHSDRRSAFPLAISLSGQRVSDGFPPLQPVNFALADNPFGAMFAVDPTSGRPTPSSSI